MSEQERRRINRNQNDPRPDSQSDGNPNLETHRQQGHDLLQAGDSIIEGLLSGNSQAFLNNSRQQGGQ